MICTVFWLIGCRFNKIWESLQVVADRAYWVILAYTATGSVRGDLFKHQFTVTEIAVFSWPLLGVERVLHLRLRARARTDAD